jgi:hypothetical protein
LTAVTDQPRPLAFTDLEARTLASVLDHVIPPSADGRLPGAGALGIAAYVEDALRRVPDLRAMIVDGLAALDAVAREKGTREFAALTPDARLAALNEQGFVLPLTFQAVMGYYQHPRVVEALGLEARAPHPKGYTMAPGDLTLLDVVRGRPKLFRS